MASLAVPCSESCCLCGSQLECDKGKGRHKKINGACCITKREVLRNCMLELDKSCSVNHIFNGNVTICYSCCMKLKKIKKLEEDVKKLRVEIHNFLISHSHTISQQQTSSSVYRRNQSPSESDTGPSAKVNKKVHTHLHRVHLLIVKYVKQILSILFYMFFIAVCCALSEGL